MTSVLKRLRFVLVLSVLGSVMLTTYSCDDFNLDDFLNTQLTEEEVAAGLRKALEVATDTSVGQASTANGYLTNAAVKILLPPEVQTARTYLGTVPGGSVISDAIFEELIVRMNRAAENAATKASPIFVDAITNITINDAFDILYGGDTAATYYLKNQTFTPLKTAFQPDIQNSLEAVGAQQTWSTLTSNYNNLASSLPFFDFPEVNTDLADYTTGKALDGLFHYVAEEEKEIRENPLDRVTELLERVFGSLD